MCCGLALSGLPVRSCQFDRRMGGTFPAELLGELPPQARGGTESTKSLCVNLESGKFSPVRATPGLIAQSPSGASATGSDQPGISHAWTHCSHPRAPRQRWHSTHNGYQLRTILDFEEAQRAASNDGHGFQAGSGKRRERVSRSALRTSNSWDIL